MRSLGLFGALAAAVAGGGYYAGKHGVPLPPKLAALVDRTTQAAKPAVESIRAEVKFAESPTVKSSDKFELSHLFKTGDTKNEARPAKAPRSNATRTARSDASKADASKSGAAKTDSAKSETVKSETVKAEAAKTDAKKSEKIRRENADGENRRGRACPGRRYSLRPALSRARA